MPPDNSRNRFPIVLSHGIARFDFFRNMLISGFGLDDDRVEDRTHYFRCIRSFLQRHGFNVHHTSVAFAASVDRRAEDLSGEIKRILEKDKADKVHIIAHSMGGLDARHMIVDIEGMADRVATLTTIGTPHHGSSVADYVLEHGGEALLRAVENIVDLEGLRDLTLGACKEFNHRAMDTEAANSVVYQTYQSSQDYNSVLTILKPAWKIIHQEEKEENDGLVSLTSQAWTRELKSRDGRSKTVKNCTFPVQADHLNELGWWDLEQLGSVLDWLRLPSKRRDYENTIRGVYLEIAEDLVEP